MNMMHQPFNPAYQPNVAYSHFAHYPQPLAAIPPPHMHLPPPHQPVYYQNQNPYPHFHPHPPPPPPPHYYNSYQPPQLHPSIYGQRRINEFTPQAGFSSPAQMTTPVESPGPLTLPQDHSIAHQEADISREQSTDPKASNPEPVSETSPLPSLESHPPSPESQDNPVEQKSNTGEDETVFRPSLSPRFHLISFHPSHALATTNQSSVSVWFRTSIPPHVVKMALPSPAHDGLVHPRKINRALKRTPNITPTSRFVGSTVQEPSTRSKEGRLLTPEPVSSNLNEATLPVSDASKEDQVIPAVQGDTVKTSGKPLVKSFASLLRGPPRPNNPPSDNIANMDARGIYNATIPQAPLTSSMQYGFSVPALSSTDMDQGIAASLTPHQHANLLHLLKTGSGLQTTRFGTVGGGIPPQIVPRGLVNTGNLCFANSILQALVYTPPFWKLLNDIAATGLTAQRKGRAATPMIDATVAFLNEFKPLSGPMPVDPSSFPTAHAAASMAAPKPVTIPKPSPSRDPNVLPRNSFTASELYNSLKSKPTFDGMRLGHQEDAEEFLGFFLDALHEELCGLLNVLGDHVRQTDALGAADEGDPDVDKGHGRVTNVTTQDADEWQEVGKKNRATVTRTTQGTESAITAIFGGKFRSLLRASGRPDSASVEEWRCLQLDIQPPHVRSIEDALYALSAVETVTIQGHQGHPSEATKQMFVEHLPPILILHLKRFIYDPHTGIGKYGKQIRFGPELEVRSEMLSAVSKHRTFSRRYTLYGVVYHHGLAATGGHYTLEVLHPTANAYTPAARDLQHSTTQSSPTEGWMRFDDETVKLLTPDDVFGSQAQGQPLHPGWAAQDDRVAYILFYRRIGK